MSAESIDSHSEAVSVIEGGGFDVVVAVSLSVSTVSSEPVSSSPAGVSVSTESVSMEPALLHPCQRKDVSKMMRINAVMVHR